MMNEDMKVLLTPFNIGKETIKNRFVVGPMAGRKEYYNYQAAWTPEGRDYWVERAKGGFGLLVSGATMMDTKVDPYNPFTQMNLFDSPMQFIDSSKQLNERLNAYGTKMVLELAMGGGRNHPNLHAPSAVEVFDHPDIKAIELTKDEIHLKRDQMIQAAGIAKKAGFMGVDLHSLHWGYLLDEFTMEITNRREDEYGGSFENRMRLVKEIVEGIQQECGSDYPILVGLSCKSYITALNKASLTGENEAGRTLEDAIRMAQYLEKIGVAALMTDVGLYDSFYHACPPIYMPQGHGLPLYAEIKKAVSIPVMARSKMGNAPLCADAINNGMCDAVVLGRPSFADPYFPRKIERGEPEKIRPCIGCNIGCIERVVELGLGPRCAVNPRAGREFITRPKKALKPRRIAIVGGGPAGMEAARTAAECGHYAEIFEKGSALGGELFAAGAHDFKPEIYRLKDWYIRELEENNIPVHLNTEFKPEMLDAANFDTVILAVGAGPVVPRSIKGADKAVTAVEMLEKHLETGENVIIVGSGVIGCETGVDLAMQGKKVTVVDMTPDILMGEMIPIQQKMMLRDMVEQYGVQKCVGSKLLEVTDSGVIVESVADGTQRELTADTVLLAMGMRSMPSMAQDLVGKGVEIYEVGSGRRNGNVINAIQEAFEVVYHFE